jgi:hypothetical protein
MGNELLPPPSDLEAIEAYFHECIRRRVEGEFQLIMPTNLPSLTTSLSATKNKEWFPVSGMYGGFSYRLKRSEDEWVLEVSSWCRVWGGSGQEHHITKDGIKLVAEGFV